MRSDERIELIAMLAWMLLVVVIVAAAAFINAWDDGRAAAEAPARLAPCAETPR